MAENSKIQWCDDTASAWWGCQQYSRGCQNCYAETLSERFGFHIFGKTKPRLYRHGFAATVRRLNRKAKKAGAVRLCFVNSMSDFFEEFDGRVEDMAGRQMLVCSYTGCGAGMAKNGDFIPASGGADKCMLCMRPMRPATLNDLRAWAFNAIDSAPNLRFILLTKRPENIRKMWSPGPRGRCASFPDCDHQDCSPRRDNVWLLTSVEDQEQADKRIPELLMCRNLAPVLGLSVEPMLEWIDILHIQHERLVEINALTGDHGVNRPLMGRSETRLNWLICGGESGPAARPFDVAWADGLRRQCHETGTAFFLKQYGSKPLDSREAGRDGESHPDGAMADPDCRLRLNDPKGGDPSEWPEDLRVREFPDVISNKE